MKKSNIIFIFYFLIASSSITAITQTAVTENVTDPYNVAALLHLPSLTDAENKEIEEARKLRANAEQAALKNGFAETLGIPIKFCNIPTLGQIEMLRLCYNLFSKVDKNSAQNLGESLFNKEVFGDLEVFCGNSKNSIDMHIAKVTDQTQTCFGKVYWQSMFTRKYKDLTSHITTIKRRQEIVKYLVENEKLFNQIEKQLDVIKANSQYLLWFNKGLSAFEKNSAMGAYWQKFENFNRSETMLGLGARWYLFPYLLYAVIAPVTALHILNKTGNVKIFLKSSGVMIAAFLLLQLAMDVFTGFPTYNQIVTSERHCSKYAYGSANFAFALDKLGQLTCEDKKIKALFPRGAILQKTVAGGSASETLTTLLQKLKSGSFKEKPSFFSDKGRVLWCFKKLQEVHEELGDALVVLGQLDAYMGIARLYKKYAARPNAKICFTEFKQSDVPYLYAKDFWYPMLDLVLKPEEIVTNDLELGTDAVGHNMILTGPNAAGKSVSLKGIMCSIIFSHVFGIAFASKFVVTPFTKIGSHLNVADDALRGESLFKAEKNRVRDFLNGTKNLTLGQQSGEFKLFNFVIMDEMFSSTNPAEGEAAAFAISKNLVDMQQCMCLFATHFGKMKQLESLTNGYFKNYKVWVDVDADGNIKSPFKIMPGMSNQSIAIKLMQGEFDPKIINDAYKALIEQGHSTEDLVGFSSQLVDASH
ncbi:MAG: hypothetical protein US49_C0002G0112 [candidate division TM6 bacterium GW2011_GWF2_37_49]|nr:MAG: hypothetical protein US49_C0002G0112 [candidate division TM6 bacterium GW2011_GWF2_37_49]